MREREKFVQTQLAIILPYLTTNLSHPSLKSQNPLSLSLSLSLSVFSSPQAKNENTKNQIKAREEEVGGSYKRKRSTIAQ